ncbi:MAG: AI-2E family transporter [Acidobacteria bacterium RIFCSPLOWO2_12_FULL_67_14b]|nr:MAG: AI-2E family transporter [Acidobacteria bacterium RIFCSPLOWO2_12_FULL_67_14b]
MAGAVTNATPPPADDWGSQRHVQALVLIGATAGGIYLCYRLAAPFVPALAWALALAVMFSPLYRWLESKLKRPNLAAATATLVAALIVIVPATFVAEKLIEEGAKGADAIRTSVESGQWRRSIESRPRLAPLARWVEAQIDLTGSVTTGVTWLTNTAASFVQGSLVQVISLMLIFYLLFYFLRDNTGTLAAFRSMSPLSEADMDRLFVRVVDTVHATIYGTLAVAALQGTLGGLMFWWLGLPAPLLWGIVMGMLAVVPVLGAFVVWVPTCLFLVLDGSWGRALILAVWGGVVIGGIDNLLYPIFVGNRLKMHTVVTFISVVGGLSVFGPSGLILGPVVVTVTTLVLEIWRARYAGSAVP